MKQASTIIHLVLVLVLVLVFVLCIVSGLAKAQGGAVGTSLPDISGVWIGKADIMLPDGLTRQIHRFEFIQEGPFLRGRHSWQIPARNLESHDGRAYTYDAVEPLLGVIGHDGTIHVVERDDATQFRMRLINRDALDFVAVESGQHPLVGHGVLLRE